VIECIFTLDYEIYGDGSGSLTDLVYEPTERLREIFRRWNAPFVNFVEVAELQKIETYGTDPAIDLVKKQIRALHCDGFEIGLHLHPQWCNARYEHGHWVLDYQEYNLCTLPQPRIAEIVSQGIGYLRSVLGQPSFTPLSFRAGNWLFQPTKSAASVLAECGIRIDSSVFKGGLQRNHHLDYRNAPKQYYWPFEEDVNQPVAGARCLEFPIHTEMVPFWRMLTAKRLGYKNSYGGTGIYHSFGGKLNRLIDFLRFRYPLKLDFTRMTLSEMTSTMNGVIEPERKNPNVYRPIVVIGHSKDLVDPKTVEHFLSFLHSQKIGITTFGRAYSKLQETGQPEFQRVHVQGVCQTEKSVPDIKNDFAEAKRIGALESQNPVYVLITPARNEAALLEQTIQSVMQQSVKPVKWVIVSDGSTDGTDEIVKEYAARYEWMELVRMPERKERHFAGKVHAFNAGYARVQNLEYDVIGNLDADITFGSDYFEFLMKKFAENPQLGVAGTPFREDSRQYDYRFTSIEHVSGACQLFRRNCFEQIGGYQPIRTGGVDLVAVITARMKGWQTRTFLEKTCFHHRKMGTAKRSPLAIAFDGGRTDYTHGCYVVWELFRSVYQMTRPPLLLGGVCGLAGFLWAMVTRAEKVVTQDLIRFRRKEQMRRLRDFFMNLLPHWPAKIAAVSLGDGKP
jgi:poly-beta-1,6-N-acetyl-D-glucosamine synthase